MKRIIIATIAVGLLVGNIPSVTTYHNVVEEPQRVEKVIAVITAYTSSVDETDDTPNITASGEQTREGIVACPAEYEFGTKIVINGDEYECQDRMHKRYRDGHYFDIWVESKDEAYEWGRRELAIVIRK